MRPILSLLLIATAWSADPVEEILALPRGTAFGCTRTDGTVRLLDDVSHFNTPTNPGLPSFESSNGGMLAVLNGVGVLEGVTAYRASYTTLTSGWPGVWTAKDHTTSGPYAFRLVLDGTEHDLAKVTWNARTELIDNLLPVTTLTAPNGLEVRLLVCAPVSADGRERPRAVIYGLDLRNAGTQAVTATVVLPGYAWGRKQFDAWGEQDKTTCLDLTPGDGAATRQEVHLEPGQRRWSSMLIHEAGSTAPAVIAARGSAAWIRDTLAYQRSLVGRLATPAHPWVAAFWERQVIQALQAINLDPTGAFAGSNWGSVPVTRMTWTKDCFYACLPLVSRDAALAEAIIAWFDAHGVRPVGRVDRADGKQQQGGTAGGLSHSISLAVAAPLLAIIRYEHTGDGDLLRRHPAWKDRWADLLTRLLATRDTATGLLPTRFISDGPAPGPLHIGSNVCVAKALLGYARLRTEVWQDAAGAAPFAEAGQRLLADLRRRAGCDGWHEAYQWDGTSAASVSDGEESDTTLMPFYGLLGDDDPQWRATMAFGASPANTKYTAALYAIAWEGSVRSTAPGYNKILAAATTDEALVGEHGALTELRRQADGDGSLWWWPYGMEKQPVYGRVTRAFMNIGKASWFSGAFSVQFPRQLLGLRWDAPTATLRWNPHPVLGAVTWDQVPLGGAWRVDLAVTADGLRCTNRSAAPLQVARAEGSPVRVAPGQTVTVP